jgi:lysophospholipase L1-like esterase
MNDRALDATSMRARERLLALGDSHTFAVGVSQSDTWPKILERELFGDDRDAGVVFNAGVVGYSVGQYLLRMRNLMVALEPQTVIIGFSMATDLYDLIPPRFGGFVYGQEFGRVYFDLDENGNLVEMRDLVGKDLAPRGAASRHTVGLRIRGVLGEFALYRRFKRSTFGLWIATHFHPAGESLWPGLDTALKRELDLGDRYRWTLAGRLLEQMSQEARGLGVTLVLVNIPYLAQVYDEVWAASFGTRPEKYDRWIGGLRLAEICDKAGILYADATADLVGAARQRRTWLHHRKDGHPTAAGHQLIAEAVARVLYERHIVSGWQGGSGSKNANSSPRRDRRVE